MTIYISRIVGLSLGYSLVVLSTLLRLGYKSKRQRFWWDDLWVLVALAATVFNVVLSIVSMFPPQGGFSSTTQSFIAWACFFAQATVIWASRLSIQTNIVNLLPEGRKRFISKCACMSLAVGWAVACISKIFYNGVPVPNIPAAPFSTVPTYINIALNLTATGWLIGWPTYILFHMKLQKPVRRLFSVCFASGILMAFADIFHGVNLLLMAWSIAFVSAHLQLILSCLLANTLILAGYFYQVFRKPSEEERSNDNPPTSRPCSHAETIKRSLAISREGSSKSFELRFTHREGIDTAQRETGRGPVMESFPSSSVGPLTTLDTSDEERSAFDVSASNSEGHHRSEPFHLINSSSSHRDHLALDIQC